LTGFPNYPSGNLYPGYRVRFRRRETINGVPVIRAPLYPSHDNSGMKRVANYLSFAMSASVSGRLLPFRPDVIHVYHPPLTVGGAGWLLGRLWRTPFTIEIQDLWPETLAATGMVRSPAVLGAVGRFAKFLYRRAAAIRVISPGFRRNLVEKGVPENKIRTISNWVDNDFYKPLEPDRAMADRFGLSGRFNLMFAGNIGLAQGLDLIVEAADAVKDLADVQFVFVGDGADLPRIKELASQRGLSNVVFLGRHPPDAMPQFFAMADGLIVNLRDDPLFRITIPHKILTYLASGKPILAAVAGDPADVVERAEAGLISPPGDAAALAASVRRLHAMSLEERKRMGENGRRAAVEEYGKDRLVGEMIDMILEAGR
jgi:glycosyltransferase involved in cell wall biosynthesis